MSEIQNDSNVWMKMKKRRIWPTTITVMIGLWMIGGCVLAATFDEWPQLYGDSQNTNYTPCYLGPPLVPVWWVTSKTKRVQRILVSGGIALHTFPHVWLPGERRYSSTSALSLASGDLLWASSLDYMFISRGLVYASKGAPTLSRLSLENGKPMLPDFTVFHPISPHPPNPVGPCTLFGDLALWRNEDVYAFNLATGAYQWWLAKEKGDRLAADYAAPHDEPVGGPGPHQKWFAFPKGATDGRVFVFGPDLGWLSCVRLDNGGFLWADRPGNPTTYALANQWPPDLQKDPRAPNVQHLLMGYDTWGSPAIFGDIVVTPLGDGGVAAYDLLRGRSLWKMKDGLKPRESGKAYVIRQTNLSNRYIDDFHGTIPDHNHCDWTNTMLALAPENRAVLYPSEDGFFYCLDIATGEVRWRQPWEPPTTSYTIGSGGSASAAAATAPTVARYEEGEVVYLRSAERLSAFDVATGKLLWAYPLPLGACPLAAANGALFVTTSGGRVVDKDQEQALIEFAPAIRLYRLGDEVNVEHESNEELPWTSDNAGQARRVDLRLDEKLDLRGVVEYLLREQNLAGKRGAFILGLRWVDDARRALLAKDLVGRQARAALLDRLVALVEALKPDCVDLGPQCNWYLRDHPDTFSNFVSLCATARERIRQVSPNTLIMVSFQYELWQGSLMRRKNLGDIAPGTELKPQTNLLNLVEPVVDCLGIWSDPGIVLENSDASSLQSHYQLLDEMTKPLVFVGIANSAGDVPTRSGTAAIVEYFRQRFGHASLSMTQIAIGTIGKRGESKSEIPSNPAGFAQSGIEPWTGCGLVGPAPEVIRTEVDLREKLDVKALCRKITRSRTLNPPRTALLVALQWLDASKKNLTLPSELNGKAFKDPETQKCFLDHCEALAKSLRPDYLDVGPECNFYLREHPEDFPAFVTLCKTAKERLQAISPETKVMVSFQYELWQGWKKRLKNLGSIKPEEELKTQFGLANQFEGIVDCLGVSTDPSVVFAKPSEIPLDYYYRLANATKMPLVFTGIGWATNQGVKEQAEFIETLVRRIYWLDPMAVIWAGDNSRGVGSHRVSTGYQPASAGDDESAKAWQELLGWRLFPQRPQPGPPIRLRAMAEGF